MFSQFGVAHVGVYVCEVWESGEEEIVDSQLLELSLADPTSPPAEEECERLSEKSVLFQLRVATSDCSSWNQDRKSAIAEEFQSLLLRLLSTQCVQDCGVTVETLTIVSLECSDVIEGEAVFRGSIETDSASQTEMVICALSRWQRSRPLVSVEGSRSLVDSECQLQIASYAEEECVEAGTVGGAGLEVILVVVLPVALLMVAAVFGALLCGFYLHCRRRNLIIS